MLKRQDAGQTSTPLFLVLFAALIAALAGACQPLPTPTEPSPSHTAAKIEPTHTVEPTALPTETPTSTLSPTHTPTPDCHQIGGKIEEASFFSDMFEKELSYIIYLPPCYQYSGPVGLPVLYLLHGLNYGNDHWLRLGLPDRMDALIAEGQISPFIVVLPRETPSQPDQIPSFPEVLTQELIPWIDSQYATQAEKSARGIGGVSRGAAWAVQIGFEHPDLFCCIGAHSLPLFQSNGGKVNGWLTQAPVEDLPRVFVDIGQNDQAWPTAKDFADQLNAAHIPHEWYLFSGGHTEAYWSSHLEHYLQWYAGDW